MPHMINGIGTWYYGKVNVHESDGKCEFCGREGKLRSYDTTLYFVFFMIPIIPLGKKRVLAECPSCRRHRAAKLEDWQRGKAQALDEARQLYRQTPGDPAAARKLIGTCLGYQDTPTFLRFVPEILQSLGTDIPTLKMIASVYMTLGNHAEAEKILRLLLGLEDAPEGREMMAEALLRQQRPDEAEPFLAHAIRDELPDRMWLLFLSAQAYQAQGRHEKALEMLDQCRALVPQVEKNKDYIKARKLSEKNRRSGKAIKVKGLGEAGVRTAEGSRAGAGAAKLIGPLVIAAIFGAYLYAADQKGKSRDVFVVNGLSKPYMVTINGAKMTLPPARPSQIKVAEGELSIHGEDPETPVPDSKVRIETPFWTRPFVDKTFVINPDQVAGILWERRHYSKDGKNGPAPQSRCDFGKPLQVYSGIDYPFQEFPREVRSSSSWGGATPKEGLSLLREPKELAGSALQTLERNGGKSQAVEFAKLHLKAEPEASEYVWFLHSNMEPKALLELLQPGLGRRPLLIEWHRMYQDARESADPGCDLEADYRKLAEELPNDGQAAYLLGRSIKERARRLECYHKALAADPAYPVAFFAVAGDALLTGDFPTAAEFAVKGSDLLPDDSAWQARTIQILQAAGRHDDALARLRKLEALHPQELGYISQEVELLCGAGRPAEIGAVVDRALRPLEQRYGTDATATIRRAWAGQQAYCSGDGAKAVSFWEKDTKTHPNVEFTIHLTKGQPDEAAKALAAMEDVGLDDDELASHRLELGLAYSLAGNAEAAEKAFASAAEALRRGDRESKLVAAALARESAPDAATILELPLAVELKRVALPALGLQYPEHKEAFFGLAEKLNFGLNYPRLLIKSALEKGKGG